MTSATSAFLRLNVYHWNLEELVFCVSVCDFLSSDLHLCLSTTEAHIPLS